MKNFMIILAALFAFGCAESKVINGVEYEPCGLLDDSDCKDPSIRYEANIGNVIWGVILVETVVVPIWLFGFELYEPTYAKPIK